MRKFIYILLIGSAIWWNHSVIDAKEIWVSPTGSPSGDGSITNPYDITTACQEKIQQGDIVMAKEGNYNIEEEIVITHSGTERNPIIIKSADGKYKAVINILESHDMGFHVEKANYITFDGFKFTGGDRGFNIIGWDTNGNHRPCKGIIIRNCTFDGKQGDLIKVLWADDILIENNVFIGSHDEQVDLLGVWGGVVRNNVFRDFPDLYGQACLQIKGGSKNVIIEKNLFYKVSEKSVTLGSYTDDEFMRPDSTYPLEAEELTLRNNIFYNSSGSIAINDCQGARIYNNTFWINQLMWKVFILWGNTSNVKVCNNIIVASDIGKLVDHQEGADKGFEAKNNIFWDGDGSIGWGTVPKHKYENTIQLNPLLKDPSNGDFHLLEGSPAIDKGISLTSIIEDYEGTIRPQGNGIDIGAFEFKTSTTKKKDDKISICYPNPSIEGQEITFDRVKEGSIIKIFNVCGELIKQINDSPWKWDLTNNEGRKVASGSYIYVIIINNYIDSKGKLSIIR